MSSSIQNKGVAKRRPSASKTVSVSNAAELKLQITEHLNKVEAHFQQASDLIESLTPETFKATDEKKESDAEAEKSDSDNLLHLTEACTALLTDIRNRLIQLKRGVIYQKDTVPEPLLDPKHSDIIYIRDRCNMEFPELWDAYLKARASFWTEHEVNLVADVRDWKTKLIPEERELLKHILAFFACSDNIVIENISKEMSRVTNIEARAFYIFQELDELIHASSYSKMLHTLVDDPEEVNRLLTAYQNCPAVKRKAEWAMKWTSSGAPFSYNVLAYICVEVIYFSTSFSIFDWFKSRGLLTGCCSYNDFISGDEAGHGEYGCMVFTRHVANKPSEEVISAMILEAVALEKAFFTDIMPKPINGMSDTLMHKHVNFICNSLFARLGLTARPFEETTSPFEFARLHTLNTKVDFFNALVTQYQLAKNDVDGNDFSALF